MMETVVNYGNLLSIHDRFKRNFYLYLGDHKEEIMAAWRFWASHRGKSTQGPVPVNEKAFKVFMLTYMLDYYINGRFSKLSLLLQTIGYMESTMQYGFGSSSGSPPFGVTTSSAYNLSMEELKGTLPPWLIAYAKRLYRRDPLANIVLAYLTLVEKYKYLKGFRTMAQAHKSFLKALDNPLTVRMLLIMYNGSYRKHIYGRRGLYLFKYVMKYASSRSPHA